MDSLAQIPQEILLIIITLCDGVSIENLKYASKAFNQLVHTYIEKYASFQELACKVIPVHIYSYYCGAKYHTHFHQLLNGKLHGKCEIYRLAGFRYKIYMRMWLENDKIKYRGVYIGYKYFNNSDPHDIIEFIRENAVERTIGIKRKRGQYSIKN
jgi:hypothetical protein